MQQITHFNNHLRTTDDLPSHITYQQYLQLLTLPSKKYKVAHLRNKRDYYMIRRDQLLLQFMWETGGRIGDIVKVTKKDIDFENKQLHFKIKKTRRLIKITMTQELLYELSLFYNEFNEREPFNMTRQNAWDRIRKYGIMLGIKLHPHMFRHGLALYLLSQDVNLQIIAYRLGHRDPRTTAQFYLKITPEIERKVLEGVKLT
jgi:integrase/recombinase XerD